MIGRSLHWGCVVQSDKIYRNDKVSFKPWIHDEEPGLSKRVQRDKIYIIVIYILKAKAKKLRMQPRLRKQKKSQSGQE